MQNCDKALPRKRFVAKPSHHFAYLCLDSVKMYKNPLSYGTYFRKAMLKHSVWLSEHWFHFKYLKFLSNKQTFNVGRAYYCQLI